MKVSRADTIVSAPPKMIGIRKVQTKVIVALTSEEISSRVPNDFKLVVNI